MLKKYLFVLLCLPSLLFAEDFAAGQDYEILPGASSQTSAKKEVIEFFSFGCPWCYRIEDSISKWAATQGNKISFKRVPVVFHPEWVYYAKAYYAASLLNKQNELIPLLFKAIQVDKKPLASDQAMVAFFVENGVDKATAESAFTQSTVIDLALQEGNTQMGKFRIQAVPAFVINGRYKTDLQMTKGEVRLLKVLDYLVNKPD